MLEKRACCILSSLVDKTSRRRMAAFRYACGKCLIEFIDEQRKKTIMCPSCKSSAALYTPSTMKKVSSAASVAAVGCLENQYSQSLRPAEPAERGGASPKNTPLPLAQPIPNNTPDFDAVIRELVYQREEFDELFREAMDSTADPAELKKLSSLLVKFIKFVGVKKAELAESAATFGEKSRASSTNSFSTSSVEQYPEISSSLVFERSAQPRPAVSNVTTSASLGLQRPKTGPTHEPAAVSDEVESLETVRTVSDNHNVLTTMTGNRVCFSSLNPQTTEDSLLSDLAEIGYGVEHIQLFKWSDQRSRGIAIVAMKEAAQATSLVSRNDLIIDGWAVTPRLLLTKTEIIEDDLFPAFHIHSLAYSSLLNSGASKLDAEDVLENMPTQDMTVLSKNVETTTDSLKSSRKKDTNASSPIPDARDFHTDEDGVTKPTTTSAKKKKNVASGGKNSRILALARARNLTEALASAQIPAETAPTSDLVESEPKPDKASVGNKTVVAVTLSTPLADLRSCAKSEVPSASGSAETTPGNATESVLSKRKKKAAAAAKRAAEGMQMMKEAAENIVLAEQAEKYARSNAKLETSLSVAKGPLSDEKDAVSHKPPGSAIGGPRTFLTAGHIPSTRNYLSTLCNLSLTEFKQ